MRGGLGTFRGEPGEDFSCPPSLGGRKNISCLASSAAKAEPHLTEMVGRRRTAQPSSSLPSPFPAEVSPPGSPPGSSCTEPARLSLHPVQVFQMHLIPYHHGLLGPSSASPGHFEVHCIPPRVLVSPSPQASGAEAHCSGVRRCKPIWRCNYTCGNTLLVTQLVSFMGDSVTHDVQCMVDM